VPAEPSSPIPQGLAPLRDADPLRPAESPHLLAYLATIPDPRRPAGCRHPLACILGLAAAAVLAGARSMAAIAEWAADAPPMVRAALGARRDALTGQRTVPAESTIRRTLGRLDDQALAVAVGAWLADRDRRERRQRRRRAVAVDGKTLRGARRPPDGRQVHLLAAMDHTTRTVLAQREVDGAPGEVPGVRPLLAGLDLAGAVVTADALHTGQPRRRPTSPRPRPRPAPGDPRDHPRMNGHSERTPGPWGVSAAGSVTRGSLSIRGDSCSPGRRARAMVVGVHVGAP
jgi:DDE family transposase